MRRRVYLSVECNRDENLFKVLKRTELIPDNIELIPKHLPRPHDIKTILNILNVYNGLIITTDLDMFRSANDLCSQIAERINGSQISGKTLTVLNLSHCIINANLNATVKTIGVIPLGLLEQIVPSMDFQRHMVEDYYVKLIHQKGLMPTMQQDFQTSKDLLNSITGQIDEIQLIASADKGELRSICQNIIQSIEKILERMGLHE